MNVRELINELLKLAATSPDGVATEVVMTRETSGEDVLIEIGFLDTTENDDGNIVIGIDPE